MSLSRNKEEGNPTVATPQDNASFTGQPAPIGGSLLGPSGNWMGQALSYLGGKIASAFGGNGNNSPTPYPNRRNPFYQVGRTDQSMAQVASKLGVSMPSLIQANYGISSLPPQGSFMRTKLDAYNKGNVAGNIPATPIGDSTAYTSGPGGHDFMGKQRLASQFDAFNKEFYNSMTVDYSLLPKQVTAVQQIALGLSADEMISTYGMKQDPVTKVWTPPTSGPDLGPDPGSGGWVKNEKTGKWRPYRGWKKSGKDGGVPTLPDNTSTTSQTVLSLRLGSG